MIDKFDAFILDAIRSVLSPDSIPPDFKLDSDKGINEQLSGFGVRLEDLKGKLYFHNLGDLMDRGPYGVKVFRRSKELIDAGISDFIIGNHDLWESLNLWAFHLPWYHGYNFYGYSDSYDQKNPDLSVTKLVNDYRPLQPETNQPFW